MTIDRSKQKIFSFLQFGSLLGNSFLLSMLSQGIHNSALAFPFCFHRTSRLAGNGSSGPSQVLPEHLHRSYHVCDLLYSQQCVGAFQSPHVHLTPQPYLLSSSASIQQSLIVPTVTHYLRQQQPRHQPTNVFDKCPPGSNFSTGSVSN